MRRLLLALLATLALALPFAPSAQAAPEAGSVQLVGTIDRWPSADTLSFRCTTCLHVWAPPSPTPEVGSLGQLGFSLRGSYVTWDPLRAAETVRFSGGWHADGRSYTTSFDIPYLVVATYNTTPGTAAGTVAVGGRSGPATFTWVTEYNAATGVPTFQGTIEYAIP